MPKVKNGNVALLESMEHLGKEAAWMATLVLWRGVTVPVAVHEGIFGRNVARSRPLQASGMLISTAEYSVSGERTQKCITEQ